MKYNSKTLDELCDVKIGRTPPRNQSGWFNSGASDDWKWVSIKDMGNCGKFITATSETITDKAKKTFNYATVTSGTILLSFKLTLGRVVICNGEFVTNEAIAQLPIKDPSIIDRDYLYYYLKNYNWSNIGSTSSIATAVNSKMVKSIKIVFPDLETQKKIVRILSALDQKIELNHQQNETLFELGRQLYIEKFENNQTINKVELGSFFPVITGKKDANASSENGKYPFFTCSKTISKIDDYVFDASAILLAGNGDFNVKFYRGKFDAYQRTYVLIPNNPEYLGFLYWAISYNLPTITANYRGSVIKFITKGNIESFKVPFVDNKYIPTFMKYLEKIEKNNQQNEVLAGLRDVLLPKLMSGEINLNEITINE